MKSFVTGGAGFLGSAVVRRLLDRGDEVVGLARSDAAATTLTRLGALPVRGDITDAGTLGQLLTGVDVVFHIAGDYRVGIKESEHEAMFRTNVDGATIVLDAAITAGVQSIVYVSTVGVFGNTRGKVVDETYERPDRDFLSYYDATKYMAHRVAVARQAAGAPLVIAQPGAVYGPGDRSELGAQIDQAARGKYSIRAFEELGFTMGYIDDVADGVVLTQAGGTPGETYVLGGEVTRLGAVVDTVADLTGTSAPASSRRPPCSPPRGRSAGSSAASPAPDRTCTRSSAPARTSRTGRPAPRRSAAGVRAAQPGAGPPRPPRGALTGAPGGRSGGHCVKYCTMACCSWGVTCAPRWIMLSMSACASAALPARNESAWSAVWQVLQRWLMIATASAPETEVGAAEGVAPGWPPLDAPPLAATPAA